MKKSELAEKILYGLLDNGMIALEYGSEFYDIGKQECIAEIKSILNDYVIVEGLLLD